MFTKSVQEIASLYPGENIEVGDNISPDQIIQFTELFKQFDLTTEDVHLVIFDKNNNPLVVITDLNIFYLHNQLPDCVKITDYNPLQLKGLLSDNQVDIINKITDLINNKKNEHRKTLDSFVNKIKTIVDADKQNFENKSLFFDGKYIELLLHESEELIKLCNALNSDELFIRSVNLVFDGANQVMNGYKAEHLLIFDIIKAYKDVITTENEKTRFTLAYFFERLKGNDFAKGISVQRLNEMTTKQFFIDNVEKIKNANILSIDQAYKDQYLLTTLLHRIDHNLFLKTGNLIYRFASIVVKGDNVINDQEKQALKKVLEKTSHPAVSTESDKLTQQIPEGDTLEIVMNELKSLIGLEEVKKSIDDFINYLKIQKIRKEKGLENVQTSLHAVFLGPPGTGKTTVARLLGRIYKHLGYLQKGHLVETDRAGMVAGFVGQTAIKVNEIVNTSLDGVLFIDEAYLLVVDNGDRDFGSEAIDTLVKRMEDNREKLVVIVAGYTEPMKEFIESNHGLRSRFSRYFVFDHFLPLQLLEIMKSYCKKSDFTLTDEAADKLLDTFEMLYEKRDESFGNARVVRNIFERCIQHQANRLVAIPNLTNELLQTLEAEDIPEPKLTVEQVFLTKEK
ncbi:MAG TPA: AAA family ATPase [Paludibacter sp.]|nr:AAA family ATPase [Paludibacter sp.]